MNGRLYVSNIQKMSINDGPGIRTTIFLKGCSLHCPWCANPENIDTQNQLWFDEEQCIGNEDCCCISKMCNKIVAQGKRGDTFIEEMKLNCPLNALKTVAALYTPGQLKHELMPDRVFWMQNGGVTFSGGEPLLQIYQLEPLLRYLKDSDVDICFETALFVPSKKVQAAIQYASRMYIDMKILVQDECKQYLGGNIEQYFRNLEAVIESGVTYTVRIPLIKPYTYNDGNLYQIECALEKYRIECVEIFSCHDMAKKKYAMLGRNPVNCGNVSETELKTFANRISVRNRTVNILHLR